MTQFRPRIRQFRHLTNMVLNGFIATLLGGMVLLAAAQIVLRNLFSFSLFWGDELLQLAVLWLVMAGAVAAARNGEHIRINILVQFIPRGARPWLYAVLHAFTAAVCLVLAWQSMRFVLESARYGDTLLGNVPAWAGQSVIPVGFGLLTLHYATRLLKEVFHGCQRRSSLASE